MTYIVKYEVPPVPTAPPGTDEWYCQEAERACHLAFLNPGDVCFYCGKPLTCDRLVMWCGVEEVRSRELWLHAACAVELGLHLVKDGMTAFHTLEKCL